MQIQVQGGLQLGLRYRAGNRMPERIFVRVQEDAYLIVVSCTAVGMEGQDVGSNYFFDVEVSWF